MAAADGDCRWGCGQRRPSQPRVLAVCTKAAVEAVASGVLATPVVLDTKVPAAGVIPGQFNTGTYTFTATTASDTVGLVTATAVITYTEDGATGAAGYRQISIVHAGAGAGLPHTIYNTVNGAGNGIASGVSVSYTGYLANNDTLIVQFLQTCGNAVNITSKLVISRSG